MEDPTYKGRRYIQLIECKYSTDTNMHTIIENIYNIYEPLRQAILTCSSHPLRWKAEVQIIPIVISRTGSFHVQTLAEIAKLVSFTEDPPDALTYKQLPQAAKEIAMALHIHAQEWLTLMSKISRNTLLAPRHTQP